MGNQHGVIVIERVHLLEILLNRDAAIGADGPFELAVAAVVLVELRATRPRRLVAMGVAH